MKNSIIFLFLFASPNLFSQLEKVKFELEKTDLKINVSSGLYKSRLSGSSPKENSFSQPAFLVQVYFPFKRSLDTPSNFEIDKNGSNYYDRLFSACPVAIFHITEKGGNCLGLGQELSFKIARKWFIKSQIAIAWTESNEQKNDGLKSGLNFHHFWYISNYITNKTAIQFGYIHISNGKILSRETGALFDMIAFGVSHTFSKKQN